MTITYLRANILLLFLIPICYSSFGQVGKQTTIVVNFKTNADRRFTAFGQLNPLHLEPAIVAPPEHKIDTSNKLRTVIRLAIAEPKYLALGFNIFYVKPGDSVNVNYETLFHTKMEFKDSIRVNYGNTFFLFRNGENGPLHKSFMNNVYQTLSGFKSASQITSYLSPANIHTLGAAYTRLTYSANPNLAADTETKKNVENITFQAFERQLLYKIKSVYKNTKTEPLRSAILQGVTGILSTSCTTKENVADAVTLGKYSALYVFFKEMNLDEKAIQSKFSACNDTVRQYILINLLQDGMLPESLTNKKENLLAKLSYPPFMAYAQQVYKIPNRGVEKLGFLNNTLRNVTLFDASDQQISFGELFQNTKQPYLIFDFCGSWCKPCLVEMSQYKQTKNLDNSKQIRPVWLFFENDKTKWMDVVKQYDLNPDNCFVILGANSQAITKEFALLFDWQGEFPHHFVFAKEGRIVQKNAGSLSSFSEQQLGPTIKKSSPQLPGPPALPGIK